MTSTVPFVNIDRLLTVEMRRNGLPQNLIARLFETAKATSNSTESLVYRIADELNTCKRGTVGFLTGVYLPPHFPKGEIDGPIGSLTLGRALTKLGFSVEILVEDQLVPVLEALTQAAAVPEVRVLAASKVSEADVAASWEAAISIERIGANAKGVRHSIMGTPFDSGYQGADEIVRRLNEAGKLTIGIGDGGNEIGFGAIYAEAREIVPFGKDCGCPCGDGIVTATATRYVLPSSVSNFGAHAIAAGLAILHEDVELAPSAELVEKLIRSANAEGCLDGGTVNPDFIGDDGIPIDGVKGYVAMLNTIVRQYFTAFDRHF